MIRSRLTTVVLDDGEVWRTRLGDGKAALAVAPTVLGGNAGKLDVQSKAPSSEEAYSFVAQSGDALLFDPDQPVLEIQRTATGGLLLAPASVLGPRSAANDQLRPNSEIPFSMQSLARSIGRRGLPQTPARNGLMPEPGNGLAARGTSLRASSKDRHRKMEQKKTSASDAKKKALSKKDPEARKKKANQKKKHGFWW